MISNRTTQLLFCGTFVSHSALFLLFSRQLIFDRYNIMETILQQEKWREWSLCPTQEDSRWVVMSRVSPKGRNCKMRVCLFESCGYSNHRGDRMKAHVKKESHQLRKKAKPLKKVGEMFKKKGKSIFICLRLKNRNC